MSPVAAQHSCKSAVRHAGAMAMGAGLAQGLTSTHGHHRWRQVSCPCTGQLGQRGGFSGWEKVRGRQNRVQGGWSHGQGSPRRSQDLAIRPDPNSCPQTMQPQYRQLWAAQAA